MNKDRLEPGAFDARMVEWNIKHELISKEQLDKHLKALPDDAENCEALHIEEDDMGEEIPG